MGNCECTYCALNNPTANGTCGSTLCKDCLGDAGECKTCELERTLDKGYAKPTQLVTVNDAIRFLKHCRLTQGGNARLSDYLADNIDR